MELADPLDYSRTDLPRTPEPDALCPFDRERVPGSLGDLRRAGDGAHAGTRFDEPLTVAVVQRPTHAGAIARLITLATVVALLGAGCGSSAGDAGDTELFVDTGGNRWRDPRGNTCSEYEAHFGDYWTESGLNPNEVWCPASVPKHAKVSVGKSPKFKKRPASQPPGPRRGELHASIEDTLESPEFSMDVPLTVTFGRYTLVVDDSSSCAFHMWGPGVDVITSDGVNRFQVELRRNATYTAACNWKDIGPHPPHSEGLYTDNMPWSATVRVTR